MGMKEVFWEIFILSVCLVFGGILHISSLIIDVTSGYLGMN